MVRLLCPVMAMMVGMGSPFRYALVLKVWRESWKVKSSMPARLTALTKLCFISATPSVPGR
jgi:hypothetical protein